MVNFNEKDLKYIEKNINEDIKILQLDNPNEIEQYGVQELTEHGYNVDTLIELKNNFKLANENESINKQIEEYCIWIIGMWLYMRFDEEVDDLDNTDENYRSIYGKIIRDQHGKKRYYGDGITFYDVVNK